ncbi:xanthine dehydrogenase family protein subunit M [Rhodopseudomonas sp. B29]|uniref:FAD binding domain-containing protein n=1 Tax=Rhodopseudomonas sp. B29 TaxID=95607 RepID=UPI0003471A05|nr:FAD binding domain-containing protein [Rhodopseudomonas sp. B29]
MKPAAFDYLRAETRDEVLAALEKEGADARIIAGGQSLMPMLNMRLARPKLLIDIMRIAPLAQIDEAKGEVVIGASVRQAQLLGWESLRLKIPLVAQALPWTGHAQTRSRGTVCGSIAHADPSAELPLCLIALRGTVHLRSAKAKRRVTADDYITGMMNTARSDDEMIEAVSFPVVAGRGYGFREVARRHGDFALVACAAIVDSNNIRLAVGGVSDQPEARDWPRLEGSALDDALNAFAYEVDARSDTHATARYRRELVRRVGRQVIEEATQCLG